jgi:hypothetical protein
MVYRDDYEINILFLNLYIMKLITHCIYIGCNIAFRGTKKECDDNLKYYPNGYVDHIF